MGMQGSFLCGDFRLVVYFWCVKCVACLERALFLCKMDNVYCICVMLLLSHDSALYNFFRGHAALITWAECLEVTIDELTLLLL
ncbi:hypothetical protein RJT34_27881 [Clitoria ternatea]|uniref:Uncharacterized protein n=1 Tax=Clitoria ternatea TaxID=43366 RepID=A0AAN9FDC5_CLITE